MQDAKRSSYGRLYRYVASVKLVADSGEARTVDVAAGFTAFIPAAASPPASTNKPSHHSVEAVEVINKYSDRSCEDDTTDSKDRVPGKLALNVISHSGLDFVQGSSYISKHLRSPDMRI